MKRNRRRSARSILATVGRAAGRVAAGLAVAAGALLVERGLAAAARHPYFSLREIDVHARGRLDAKTVVAWAGIFPGMSVWDVSERDAEQRMLAHGRIRQALVERTLPGKVRIAVEEREPVGIVLANRSLLVGADGEVFPEIEGEPIDGLPYVTGFAGKDLSSAPAAERLRAAARVIRLWREHSSWPVISEVRPEGEELVVFVAGTPLAVRFAAQASTDDFARLSAVLELWRGREAQVAAIDLSLPGEAVLKLRQPPKKRPAGRTSI